MTQKELPPTFLVEDKEATDILKTPDEYTRTVFLVTPEEGITGPYQRGVEKSSGWKEVERVGDRMASLHDYARLFGVDYFQHLHLTLQATVFYVFGEGRLPIHIEEDMKKEGMGNLEMGWIKMLAASIEPIEEKGN